MTLAEQKQRHRILIRDRDSKFTAAFDEVFRSQGLRLIKAPIAAPRAKAHADRWVGSARRRRRIPNITGPSRLSTTAGRLLAPPAGVLLAATGPHLRRCQPAVLTQDLLRLTMVRRGIARARFHVVAEVVPEERLLFLSSRPGSPPPAQRAMREAVEKAFEAGLVERIVWNHSRVSAGAGVGGGSLLSLSVGHDGVEGAYAFQVLPALAPSQPDLVLDVLEPMLRKPAPEPTPPSASRPERTLLHMSTDERVLSEAVDGVEVDVVVPPDLAPLARQTLAYGLSGLIVPLVGMITLPIFARVFTRSQYGLIELGTTTLTVAIAITDAGLTAAALRSFYDYTAEQEPERRSVMLTGFLATSAIALAVALLLVGLRDDLSRWLFGEPGHGTLLILIAGSVLVLNTWRYVAEVMRVRFQASSYLAMSALAAAVTTALGVAGVLALGWRVNGVFFAAVVGNAAAAAYGVLAVRRWLKGRFSTRQLRSMLAYGLPLVPSALSAWALALVDRIILSRVGSLSEVGEYAVANRLALLLLIGMTAFLFALSPFLLSTYSEDPEQEKAARGRTLTYLTFILALAGLGLTLFAKEIFEIVAPKFDDAYLAVGPLALGTALYGISAVLTTGLAIVRKTVHLAVLAVGAAVLNVALNFALIPPFGIVGAGVATAGGYGALALSYYWLTQRLYPTPYEPRKVVTMLAAASLLGLLGLVPFEPVGVSVVVKLAAVVTFVGVSWLTGAMTGTEFRELRRFATGMLRLAPG